METGKLKPTTKSLGTTDELILNFTWPFYATVKKDKTKGWYFTLVGRNNEKACTSESHKNKTDVVELLKLWFPQIHIKLL